MPAILNARVQVDGQIYGPGPIPDEIAAKIRNKSLFTDSETTSGSSGSSSVDLGSMKKAELIAHAEQHGIDLEGAKTNAEIISAIEAAE